MAGRSLHHAMSTPAPHFSIIVAVYNDWKPLEICLRSLSQQVDAPAFEVIVVDDGSDQEAPESIRNWSQRFCVTILRQQHAGISATRNRGIQGARGSILVFTDADCEMQSNCLAALAATISASPQHSCFQLHLAGERSNLAGQAEELRLMSLQRQTLQSNGCIRYLNTAGFAVRRAFVGADAQLFDPVARRAEDTLLLAHLIEKGELPFFVPDAIVQHRIERSWLHCLVKDARSAWIEGPAYDMIAAKGVNVRMSDAARMKVMRSMWKSAEEESIGKMGWFLVIARRTVNRIVRSLYKVLRSSKLLSETH